MANQCEAKKGVGVVLCKIKAVKLDQSRDIRSQSTMAKILGFNIEGGTVVACEGGEEGEITNMAILIITNNAQTTPTLHPPSPLPK